jgi:hypothetical protein
MQHFTTLGQTLIGEKAHWEKERERKQGQRTYFAQTNYAVHSEHNVLHATAKCSAPNLLGSKKAFDSGHYVLPAMPKGSARTSLGQMIISFPQYLRLYA